MQRLDMLAQNLYCPSNKFGPIFCALLISKGVNDVIQLTNIKKFGISQSDFI